MLPFLALWLGWTQFTRAGLTVDEPINVGHGKRMVHALRQDPLAMTKKDTVFRLWRHGHEHPPLSRFLIGCAHHFFDPRPDDESSQVPKMGRPVAGLFFLMLVFLVSKAGERVDRAAGWTAGLACLLMPRLVSHARLASPEAPSATLFFAALYAAGWAFDRDESTFSRAMTKSLVAGVVLGLALLTKLTSVLLIPAVVVYLIVSRPRHGLALGVAWLASGAAFFVLLWPWLWPFDFPNYSPGWAGTYERLREYLAVGVDRATIYVGYLGRQYPSQGSRVPWHYSLVFFLATIPAGLQLLGSVGVPAMIRHARRDPVYACAGLGLIIVLATFSLPIQRYDGERLFLMVFPLWSLSIGLGGSALMRVLRPRIGAVGATVLLAAFLATQAWGLWRTWPFGLSYYNALVGGGRGAERWGLEPTYWGDSIDEDFLDRWAARAQPGDRAVLSPTLYDGHAIYLTSPGMREKGLRVLPGEAMNLVKPRWVIMFHRSGYLDDPLPRWVREKGRVVEETRRDGAWLTRLYEVPPDGIPATERERR